MTSEEIKQTYSMYDVLARYGLKADRHNMLSCPFHGSDRHASMKIYKDGYNCFACGANGDIFGFVMEYEGVDFKTAFQTLGGTYARGEERRKVSIAVQRRKLQAETARLKEERKRQELRDCNRAITDLRKLIDKSEPMGDMWAWAVNMLERQLYIHERLCDELCELK